jgi:predicted HicB family RNase H-like nuclease
MPDDSADSEPEFMGFYVDPDLKRSAEDAASQDGVSLSELLRRALRRALREDDSA